jgi:cytochrome c biogenesis protein CcdA
LAGVKLGKVRIQPILIGNTLFFILGVSTVFALLGFGAGALGSVVNSSWFIVICGIVVVLFGIYQTGIFKLIFMEREKKLAIEIKGKRGFAAAVSGRSSRLCLACLPVKVRRYRAEGIC